jgi:hypothetical protein
MPTGGAGGACVGGCGVHARGAEVGGCDVDVCGAEAECCGVDTSGMGVERVMDDAGLKCPAAINA